jgi:hypothetical protein
MEQMKKSITPMGIKNTALEIISLVEIFNLEKSIFTPITRRPARSIIERETRFPDSSRFRVSF